MAEPPRHKVRVTEFVGLVSNRGPYVGKPGAAKVQKNIRVLSPGSLETRRGMRELKFES